MKVAEQALSCPFCGESPYFEGDASEWMDDRRYVQLKLTCCATMTETIGWKKARDMSVSNREEEMKKELTSRWNKRYQPEEEPEEDMGCPTCGEDGGTSCGYPNCGLLL